MLFGEQIGLIGIFGLIISVLGIWIPVVTYIHEGNNKLLEYRIITDRMRKKGFEGKTSVKLEESLRSTTVEFINSGNQTIEMSDFAPMDRLRLLADGQFCGRGVIKTNNPNFNPTIKIVSHKELALEFDYIKPFGSISFEIFHEGNLGVKGELKSGKVQEYMGRKWKIGKQAILIYTILAGLISLTLLAGSIIDQSRLNLFTPYMTCLFAGLMLCAAVYVNKEKIK